MAQNSDIQGDVLAFHQGELADLQVLGQVADSASGGAVVAAGGAVVAGLTGGGGRGLLAAGEDANGHNQNQNQSKNAHSGFHLGGLLSFFLFLICYGAFPIRREQQIPAPLEGSCRRRRLRGER